MLTTLIFTLALAADPVPADGNPYIPVCQVSSIDNLQVPGADAGVLASVNVQEGQIVAKGMELARLDESDAKAQLEIKGYEFDVANQTAHSTIDVDHATAAAQVAKAAWDKLKESNERFKGTVTEIDILRAGHEYNRSRLAIDQAKEKRVEAQLTAKAKRAEVNAFQVALDRRVLRAPFDGVVVKLAKKPGEWVSPGDPVVQIVGVNRLRVMGNLDARQWGPSDVQNRKVTVEVALPRGRSVKVPGQVIYVSPLVTLGQLAVWAEIEAPNVGGRLPEVRAGLSAAMTIHVDQPVATTARPTAPRAPIRPTSTQVAPTR